MSKGFTLIEMLMVVSILALLSLFLIPNVMNLVNKNKIDSCNNTINSIKNAVNLYISDNRYDLDIDCSSNTDKNVKIYLFDLIQNNYLKSPIINPINDEELNSTSNGSYIQLKYSCNDRKFKDSYSFKLYENTSGKIMKCE